MHFCSFTTDLPMLVAPFCSCLFMYISIKWGKRINVPVEFHLGTYCHANLRTFGRILQKAVGVFFRFSVVFQMKSCNFADYQRFVDWIVPSFWDCFFFDFGSYRARMQRRGHGCSAEGTRDGHTTSQRIRTFVATALSNVRRDGVI